MRAAVVCLWQINVHGRRLCQLVWRDSVRANFPVTQNNYDFPGDELLVSVTNTKGEITHCNPAFVRVSGYVY